MPSPNPGANAAVVPEQMSRSARLRARMNQSWWMLRPALIFCALVAMFAVTFLLYTYGTVDGTYWREMAVALIGTLLTITASLGIALVAFRAQLRAHREAETLRRFDASAWRSGSLSVGAMRIPGIAVIASAGHGREWTESAAMEWEPGFAAEREEDAIARDAYRLRVPAAEARARELSIALTDDACVDLRAARIALERSGDRRRPVYRLTAARSTYYRFLATGADLDAPLEAPSTGGRSLREAWGLDVHSLEDLGHLPFLAKVGCGTAVVTSDNRLVLGVRGRSMIAGTDPSAPRTRAKVHIVAEGMTPDDVDGEGRIDPRLTSVRGMHEELSLGSSSRDLGAVREQIATGFFLDHLRMQPCFSYLARVSLSWDELRTAAPASQDFWEVTELRDMPFDISHVGLRRLLLGRHPDMEFASNHAAAVVWFACLYEFGFHRMRDALSIPLPPDGVQREEIL